MKFQNILLLAAATLVYANALELSDDETDLAPNTEDIGISSEPETGLDEPSTPDNTSLDAPLDAKDESPEENDIDSTIIDNTSPESVEQEGDPEIDDSPDDASLDNAEAAGEVSDDYGPDEAVKGAEGEASDDYGDDEKPTEGNSVDDLDVNDVDADAAGATSEVSEGEGEEDDSSDTAAFAAGIAGAAALSSAGIFLWVKRAKREEIENAPLNMA
jgi:hypothetical protein